MRATVSIHTGLIKGDHLDLFLERRDIGRLKTYEAPIEKKDSLLKGKAVIFTSKKDHRNIYLDFEGPILESRGEIARLWKGEYTSEDEDLSELISVTLFHKNLIVKNLAEGNTYAEDRF